MPETRIVHARPPAKRTQRPTRLIAPSISVAEPSVRLLDARGALTSFRRLVKDWKLDRTQAWLMLTGEPSVRTILTEDQALRVSYLLAIDTGLREIGGRPVGTWLVAGNTTPVLGGASPLAFLTRQGTPGYVALLRQVEHWMAL